MKKIKREYYFIIMLLFCFVLLTYFVVNGSAYKLDKIIFDNVIKMQNNFISNFLFDITNLASTLGIVFLSLLALIILIIKRKINLFKYIFLNVSFGVALMQVLKHIIRRARPIWQWIEQSGFSYPSGHTISAVLLYGTLIILLLKFYNGKFKNIFVILLFLMIFLTGLSRIYFGVHYFTDVLASMILGTIILIISNMFLNREFGNNDKNKSRKAI